eukprot:jgi/Mesen1/6945/ME000360S06210
MGACVARSSRPDQQQQQHQQQQQPLPSNIMDMPMPMPSSGAALVVHVPPPSFTLAMPFAPVPALMLLLPPTDYPLQQPLSAVESARDSAATSAVATSAVATSIGAAAATAPAAAAAAAAVELVSPRPESVGGRSRSSGAGGGEFQLAGHPMLVLRVLSECHLEPEDLARLEKPIDGSGAGGGLGGLGGGGAADEVVVGADEESFQKDVFKPRLVAALAGGQLAADRVVQISPSNTGHYEAHMLALTQSGRVLACGAGGKGQLGVELGGAHERPLLETVEGLSL